MNAGVVERHATVLDSRRVLLYAVVVAALAEVLLLRVIYRVGIHVPRSGAFLDLHARASDVGLYAFNLAGVLAMAVLVVRASHRSTSGVAALLASSASISLAAASVVMIAVPTNDVLRLLFLLIFDGVAVTTGWTVLRRPMSVPTRTALTLVLVAVGAFQYYAVGNAVIAVAGTGSGLRGAGVALWMAEVTAVCAGAAVYWAWGPRPADAPRRHFILGVGAAAVVLGSGFANASTTSIVALWAVGFSLSLPVAVYALTFGLFTATVSYQLTRSGGMMAMALLLLFAGGVQPLSTYQYLLLAIALGLFLEVLALWEDEQGPAIPSSHSRDNRPPGRAEAP